MIKRKEKTDIEVECDLCGTKYEFMEARLFASGWAKIWPAKTNAVDGYHVCERCLTIIIYREDLNLATYSGRDTILSKFNSLILQK